MALEICVDHESLYGNRMIVEKYGKVNHWERKVPMNPYGVSCWKGIMNQTEDFKKVIWVEVGLRSNVYFWTDR